MANRWFQQFRFSLEKQVVELWANVTFTRDGSAHAQAVVNRGKGIQSITRTAAGAYDIQLGSPSASIDTYQRLLSADKIYVGTIGDAVNLSMKIVADNSATTGIIQVLFTTQAAPNTGVELGVNSADTMLLHLALSNSFAP